MASSFFNVFPNGAAEQRMLSTLLKSADVISFEFTKYFNIRGTTIHVVGYLILHFNKNTAQKNYNF